nr:family 43 glycosylhydrolase [Granulicella aggregans]
MVDGQARAAQGAAHGAGIAVYSIQRSARRSPIARAVAVAIGIGLMYAALSGPAVAQDDLVRPGGVWLDERGLPIEAHGGGIIKVEATYYWFGEDRTPSNDPDKRYVACYSSRDLVHWKFRNQVLKQSDPEHLGTWILERPKVFFNKKTHKFVMYMHLDGPGYKVARVAVAVSDTVDGNYTYVRSFRPLNEESRDIGQFVDDDGSAYLIFESRPTKGFFIAKLSDDSMNVEKLVSFVQAPLEGGALVHYKGLYYVIGSHLTGWAPNPNVYATAKSLNGPWTEFKDIAPPSANTYDSQSSMLIKIEGREATSVIYVGDRWNPKNLPDSRYIWMPLQIGNGEIHLPSPRPWALDIKKGTTTVTEIH